MIKILKIDKVIQINFQEKYIDEDGNEVWNIPTDLDEFKTLAVDTINWQTGNNIKKAVGNMNVNLSASNSKAISLIAKLLNTLNPDTSNLTDLEKDNYNKIVDIANAGYADSQLLNVSLNAIETYIQEGSKKLADITNATTIDDVIEVLNR